MSSWYTGCLPERPAPFEEADKEWKHRLPAHRPQHHQVVAGRVDPPPRGSARRVRGHTAPGSMSHRPGPPTGRRGTDPGLRPSFTTLSEAKHTPGSGPSWRARGPAQGKLPQRSGWSTPNEPESGSCTEREDHYGGVSTQEQAGQPPGSLPKDRPSTPEINLE